MTTPLADRLKRRILQTGPISVADYMATCLFDPEDGYYTTKEPFGRSGDFVTAPEISQMFGELVAVWIANCWDVSGRPEQITFAEIGPGRGTLMRDMLRTLKMAMPEFLAVADVKMIETSARLVEAQRLTLGTESGCAEWITTIDELPINPVFLVGNELFDALPFRQFVKSNNLWLERMVGIGGDDRFEFVLGAASLDPSSLPEEAFDMDDGGVFEVSPAREATVQTIAERISLSGGAALFFDYGHLSPGFGDTFQAVREHAYEHVLASPGLADLTSHVDFAALARTAEQAGADAKLVTQGEFLLQTGLLERAGQLGADVDEQTRRQIGLDVDRLAGPDQMGNLFKTMAIFPKGVCVEPFGAP